MRIQGDKGPEKWRCFSKVKFTPINQLTPSNSLHIYEEITFLSKS